MTKRVNPGEPPGRTDEPATASSSISMADLGVTDGVGPSDLPRLEHRPAALLLFHPERWMVMHGSLVPMLGRLPVIGGVGNVKVVNEKTGKLSIAGAVTARAKHGWSVIALDVDGPGTSYLHSPLPGVYLTRWETANAGSTVVSTDGAGYVDWLRHLISRGKLPRAKPYVVEGMAARLRSEILDLQDKVRTVPSAQVQLDRSIRDLAVLERELGDVPLTPIAPKPTGLGDLVTE